MNLRMREAVDSDDAIDLSNNPKTVDGYYLLGEVVEGKDYCVLTSEEWIWSIGKSKITGLIYASTTTVFVDNAMYELLWLR